MYYSTLFWGSSGEARSRITSRWHTVQIQCTSTQILKVLFSGTTIFLLWSELWLLLGETSPNLEWFLGVKHWNRRSRVIAIKCSDCTWPIPGVSGNLLSIWRCIKLSPRLRYRRQICCPPLSQPGPCLVKASKHGGYWVDTTQLFSENFIVTSGSKRCAFSEASGARVVSPLKGLYN